MRIVSINKLWKKIMDCSGLRGRPSHVVTARGLALLLPQKYAVDADHQPDTERITKHPIGDIDKTTLP